MTEATDEQGRVDPPFDAGEWETLMGFLSFLRGTIAMKTAGLSDEQLRQRLEPSEMTLGGMLKHLTLVERQWFSDCLAGKGYGQPWDSVDWDADYDWDWHSAVEDSGETLRSEWQKATEDSEKYAMEAYSAEGMDALAKHQFKKGEVLRLRWIMLHMIEEYARHCGHADLIRESIDGQTGE